MSDPGGTLHAWLDGARMEVAPTPDVVQSVASHLPPGTTVAVTSTPGRGLEATIRVVERLAGLGYPVVPHLAARMVRDGGHLAEVLRRLEAVGIEDLFVIGGDLPSCAGPYASALDLLRSVDERGHRFREVGVGVYPEPHPGIRDDLLARVLAQKARHATYAVSQLCFDASTVVRWLRRLRRSGLALPVQVGVAGPIQLRRLLPIARRIGVGESTRVLERDGEAGSRRYQPEGFLRELSEGLADPPPGVRGLHLSTFNDLATTERWRRRLTAGATGGTAHQ